MTNHDDSVPPWWKGAVFYQIYPRSFLDTNHDGANNLGSTGNLSGDLPGITKSLDYVKSLGVDAIWISPFFPSPMKDFGYDISDYRDIDPLFGTLEDFDNILHNAKRVGLKVIIDLVLSHTSDQHPWFSDPAKKSWYVWADPKPDMFNELTPPNNWVSAFGGSAWEYNETHKQYYLHNFLKSQPDLNFHNPEVQEEALDICRFWLERGVDGFRLDVVNFYFHDLELRDNPPRDPSLGAATQFEGEDPYSAQSHIYDKSRPENLEFLTKLRTLMDEYPGTMTVGEIGDDHPFERAAEYTGAGLLNTAYNTHMMSGTHKKITANLIREPVEKFLAQPGNNWPSWAFSNHDVVRAASRWHDGGNGFSHDKALSKMLIALLGCLRGTAFIYQGEELGLPEAKLAFEDLQDPWGKHLWPQWQGRDGCRTPMPWSANTPQKQWLPVPDAHLGLNVEAQEEDKTSTLNFTRDFLKWRKTQATLIHGDIEFAETGNEQLLSFERTYKGKSTKCSFNLGTYSFEIEGYSPSLSSDAGLSETSSSET